jgi:hypothetical protein
MAPSELLRRERMPSIGRADSDPGPPEEKKKLKKINCMNLWLPKHRRFVFFFELPIVPLKKFVRT